MKKIFDKAMIALMMLAASISFTSCDDDDSNGPDVPKPSDKKITKVVVDYSVSLSDDYFELWDFEVTYTTPSGRQQTEKIDSDWSMRYNLSTVDELPTNYALKVVGKPKSPVSTPTPDRVYQMQSEYQLIINGYTAEGKRELTDGMLVPHSNKIATDGNHLVDKVAKDKTICDVNYDINL